MKKIMIVTLIMLAQFAVAAQVDLSPGVTTNINGTDVSCKSAGDLKNYLAQDDDTFYAIAKTGMGLCNIKYDNYGGNTYTIFINNKAAYSAYNTDDSIAKSTIIKELKKIILAGACNQ